MEWNHLVIQIVKFMVMRFTMLDKILYKFMYILFLIQNSVYSLIILANNDTVMHSDEQKQLFLLLIFRNNHQK